MKMIGAVMAGALAVAATITSATAQTLSDADRHDGRCVAAMLALGEASPTSEGKTAANAAVMYFTGKLMGRHNAVETKSVLAAIDQDPGFRSEAPSCVEEIRATSDVLLGKSST